MATAAGAWALVAPVAVVWSVVVFGSMVATTRYVSAGSVAAAAVVPMVTVLLDGRPSTSIGALVLAALIVWRHRSNLVAAGHTEPSRASARRA